MFSLFHVKYALDGIAIMACFTVSGGPGDVWVPLSVWSNNWYTEHYEFLFGRRYNPDNGYPADPAGHGRLPACIEGSCTVSDPYPKPA